MTRSTKTTRDTVLFIDDSRLMRFTARKSLAGDYEVVLAEGGDDAIRALADNPAITAVVTDLMMPETDGFDVIRHVRASEDDRIRALPIMAVTGSTVEGDRLRALELGADDLMTKPFRPSALRDRVARLLAGAQDDAPAASVVGPIPPVSGSSTADAGGEPVDGPDERFALPSAGTGGASPGGPAGREAGEGSGPRRIDVPAAANVERSRVGFVERLRQALALHVRHDLDIALLHLRLRNAAAIEAEMGGAMLNALMRHLEAELVEAVRAEDTVGRTGRDHYTVLLPATPLDGARRLRQRVKDALGDRPRQVRGRSVRPEIVAMIHVPKRDLDASALLVRPCAGPQGGRRPAGRDEGLHLRPVRDGDAGA
ncbi:response regulator [Halomonas denitrificans]|nr:response regulator [Halomonas denitrificans]